MNYRMVMWKPWESQLLTRRKDREGVDARQRSARFIGHVIAVLTFEKVITNVSNVREKPRLCCVHSKKEKKREREKETKKGKTWHNRLFNILDYIPTSALIDMQRTF